MAKRKITKTYGGASITMGDAFTEFMAEKALLGRAQQTLENYVKSFHYFMSDNGFTGDTPIENLDKDSFLKWLATMRSNNVKHTTINHYLRDVRSFAYWCMDLEREYITPTYKIQQVRGQEPGIKAFKEDDIKILLEKPRKSDAFGDWRTWAIVNWIMATGNRSATICEVKLEDVDFKRKMIHLRHTKNKQYQSVPLSTELSHQLKEYINLWLRNADASDYLFPNVSGEALTTNALRHSFARYCADRGVNQTNIHGLRHSFADLSLDSGRNPFELQKMLGHSTLDMTRRYIRFNENKTEKDFDKHTPLDNMKKPTARRRKIQRSE
jgi:integrase/recombinase XerD